MPISEIAEHLGKEARGRGGAVKRGLKSLRRELNELQV
jgi:hypothetical protein